MWPKILGRDALRIRTFEVRFPWIPGWRRLPVQQKFPQRGTVSSRSRGLCRAADPRGVAASVLRVFGRSAVRHPPCRGVRRPRGDGGRPALL